MSSTSQLFDMNDDYNFDLFTASSLGHISIVENILRNNLADVNGVNDANWTALMYASHYGHYNVIRTLIQYKCHVDYQDKVRGRTALMLAASNGHSRTIETLINCGKADKNIRDFEGHDAIYYAKTCGHGNNKMIKSLLGKETGYELKGRSYSTPLMSYSGPKVSITTSSNISETPKSSGNFDSYESNEMTDLYNPYEPNLLSTHFASVWKPIRKNSLENQSSGSSTAQVISTIMPPSVLDLTPSDSSCASTPSSDQSFGSQDMRRKPIAGRRKGLSSTPIFPPMPTTLFHLLTRIELFQYLDVFESNGIDFYSFLTLTDADFQALGISCFGHRKKMSIAQSRYHESLDIYSTNESFFADYLLNERDVLNQKIQALEEKINYYECEDKE